MSRRHHGRPHHHGPGGTERWRRNPTAPAASAGFAADAPPPTPTVLPGETIAAARPHENGGDITAGAVDDPIAHSSDAGNGHAQVGASDLDLAEVARTPVNEGSHAHNGPATNGMGANGTATNGANGNGERAGQCTAPQLRRFIKSRPYVPMHELRRRFGIIGDDDDVTAVKVELTWIYVGLPSREGTLLGDLLRSGEIGYELSLDPRTPIVVGVYPMRPIPRN